MKNETRKIVSVLHPFSHVSSKITILINSDPPLHTPLYTLISLIPVQTLKIIKETPNVKTYFTM